MIFTYNLQETIQISKNASLYIYEISLKKYDRSGHSGSCWGISLWNLGLFLISNAFDRTRNERETRRRTIPSIERKRERERERKMKSKNIREGARAIKVPVRRSSYAIEPSRDLSCYAVARSTAGNITRRSEIRGIWSNDRRARKNSSVILFRFFV